MVCAQQGRGLMGASLLCEHRLGLIVSRITTSRRHGQPSKGLSGGSLSAKVRGDVQKPHSQGRGMRGELAHGSKAHRHAAYGKCGACVPTVRASTWGDLHRERCDWTVSTPGWFNRVIKNQAPWRASRCVSKKRQQPSSRCTARRVATRVVTV